VRVVFGLIKPVPPLVTTRTLMGESGEFVCEVTVTVGVWKMMKPSGGN